MTTHSSSKSSLARVLALASLLALASPLSAVTYTYNAGRDWSTAANWVGGSIPTFGNETDLFFNSTIGADAMRISLAGVVARSVTFGPDVYGSTGNSIGWLNRTANNNANRTFTFQAASGNASLTVSNGVGISNAFVRLGGNNGTNFIFNSSVDLFANDATAYVQFNDGITGSGALNKYGIGEVYLLRGSDFQGGVNIHEGTVRAYFDPTAMGTGAVVLGAGDGSANTAIAFGGSSGAVATYANAITVGAGSGARTFSNLDTSNPAWVGNADLSGTMTLNKDAIFDITQYTADTHDRITVSGAVSGSGGIVKDGTGVLTFGGDNTYGGATTVSAGRLIVNGNQSAATGDLTVASGATLGGSGTIGGASTISGIHSPGNSPGVQTFAGGLTYETGATFVWELLDNSASGRGTVFDGVDVTGGTLTIDSGVSTSLVFNGTGSSVLWSDEFWQSNQSWLVFDNANAPGILGNPTISVGFDSLGNDFSTALAGSSFEWDLQDNDIYLSYVVPEPSTHALIALAAAGLGAHVVRRRRSAR